MLRDCGSTGTAGPLLAAKFAGLDATRNFRRRPWPPSNLRLAYVPGPHMSAPSATVASAVFRGEQVPPPTCTTAFRSDPRTDFIADGRPGPARGVLRRLITGERRAVDGPGTSRGSCASKLVRPTSVTSPVKPSWRCGYWTETEHRLWRIRAPNGQVDCSARPSDARIGASEPGQGQRAAGSGTARPVRTLHTQPPLGPIQ